MPLATKKLQREYQRQWILARRRAWIAENGPCAQCGGTKNLQVDHIRPHHKRMEPRELWSRSLKVREKELVKCQVLCKYCHLRKTQEWYAKRRKHGTGTMYRQGCRCEKCRADAVRRVNEWRWKTGRRNKRTGS